MARCGRRQIPAFFAVALCRRLWIGNAGNGRDPLIAQFGPASTSERRLNFAQAFNPPGTILGVLLGTYFIFSGVEFSPVEAARLNAAGTFNAYMHHEIMRVVPTYVGLGVAVLLCAVLLARTRFPLFATEQLSRADAGRFAELLPFRGLWVAVGARFFYVGAQISTWSAFIPYLRQYTSIPERTAGLLLTGNLVAFGLGRILSTPLR